MTKKGKNRSKNRAKQRSSVRVKSKINRKSDKKVVKAVWNVLKSEKFIGILCLIILPVIIFYAMEWFLRNPFEKMRFPIQLLNIVFFELVAVLLFFITKSVRNAIRIEAVLALVIGLLNYFVVQFRSNPVMPWDIYSIGTAMSVANNYEYTLKPRAIYSMIVLAIIIVVCHFIPKWKQIAGKVRIGGSVAVVICLVLLTNYVQTPQAVKTFRLYDKLFTPNTMTYRDGTIVTFLMQCQYLSVQEPKSYSEKNAQELLAATENTYGTKGENPKELPNIIVVMNEAFSDLSVLGEYTTNQDEMPYMRSLMQGAKDTVSGYMDVSVLGGNTANTEFEFLTGHTMGFLPQGCIPYQQYIHEEAFAIPMWLKDMGYRTLALHPYRSSGWDRDKVYEYFGFDKFYSQDDFENPLIYRKYISDEADIDKVIELYEEDPDTPLFMFNVTMQNHSSYTDLFDNFTPQIQVDGVDSVALNQYLSLLYESDKSLMRLVEYFEEVDDPTIVVFFGDHQPTNSVVSPIYKLNKKSVNSLTQEEELLRYKVPYVIRANFDIEEAVDIPMSANYLGIKTLEVAGLDLSAYHKFLAEQYYEYPSVSALQITDDNGETYSIEKKDELLNEYQILQYYNLFEK